MPCGQRGLCPHVAMKAEPRSQDSGLASTASLIAALDNSSAVTIRLRRVSSLGIVVKVQLEETVRATPEEFLDLVMDIERYAQVDKKISPVLWSRRDGDVLEFACRPKLVGLRQPKVVQYARLTPGRRIDIGLTPLPNNRIAHAMARFQASFECDAIEGGTRVVRTLEFRFKPLARWLFEPLFKRRLEREVREELSLAKNYLEQRA